MFAAEEAVKTEFGYRPTVRLLDAPNDPLGKLAFIAKAYQGVFEQDYSYITDEDRKYYIQDMEKNILGMPSEAVQFHFLLENVTRSFTHQLVRTRHASYAQESMRFAVKEDFPVQLPPSLLGTESLSAWLSSRILDGYLRENASDEDYDEHVERYASDKQKMRFKWDQAVSDSGSAYADLIESGMPAEDARGLAPHAIVTKINWVVDLRALMATAGQRLCTQAQWEHREMWNSLIASIRDYGSDKKYLVDEKALSSEWQFELLADRFKPVCYQTGRCQFRSDFDRYCNIRDRVEANHKIGRPSSEWDKASPTLISAEGSYLGIPAIHPAEWLSPDAAIHPDAEWRSDESLKNIQGRRR
jgi:flavin-dependent thymidylate synthase